LPRPSEDGAGPVKAEAIVSVGHFLKPYGLKGEIKFDPYYPEFLQPEDLPAGFKCLADRDTDNPRVTGLPVSIASVKSYQRFWVFRFEGFDTPEAVARLTNRDLWIDRAGFPPLPEGEYLDADLIGCVVVDGEMGELGKIKSIIHTGANDIWEVGSSDPPEVVTEGATEVAPKKGEEILIPVLDHVVLSVDTGNKRITVNLPEGLLD
jgi:16S rRNA processing protein RimM